MDERLIELPIAYAHVTLKLQTLCLIVSAGKQNLLDEAPQTHLHLCQQGWWKLPPPRVDKLKDKGPARPKHAHVDVLAAGGREARLVSLDPRKNRALKQLLWCAQRVRSPACVRPNK